MNATELAQALAANLRGCWQSGEQATFDALNTEDEVKERWILTIEADDIPASEHINDADCWGKVSKYAFRYGDREPRPDGFTWAARKIQVDCGSWMWWEPYRDEDGKVYDDAESMAEVRRLLEEGFLGVTVVRRTQCHCCGNWSETARASLWGIDSLENGYGLTVVEELIEEVLSQRKDGG